MALASLEISKDVGYIYLRALDGENFRLSNIYHEAGCFPKLLQQLM
jgi:hypothetical protein